MADFFFHWANVFGFFQTRTLGLDLNSSRVPEAMPCSSWQAQLSLVTGSGSSIPLFPLALQVAYTCMALELTFSY